MVPVDGFNVRPAGTDEKVPPCNPVMVGVCGLPVVQYVADGYVNAASSAGFITTVDVALTALHIPLAGMVLVIVYVPATLPATSISPVFI